MHRRRCLKQPTLRVRLDACAVDECALNSELWDMAEYMDEVVARRGALPRKLVDAPPAAPSKRPAGDLDDSAAASDGKRPRVDEELPVHVRRRPRVVAAWWPKPGPGNAGLT